MSLFDKRNYFWTVNLSIKQVFHPEIPTWHPLPYLLGSMNLTFPFPPSNGRKFLWLQCNTILVFEIGCSPLQRGPIKVWSCTLFFMMCAECHDIRCKFQRTSWIHKSKWKSHSKEPFFQYWNWISQITLLLGVFWLLIIKYWPTKFA